MRRSCGLWERGSRIGIQHKTTCNSKFNQKIMLIMLSEMAQDQEIVSSAFLNLSFHDGRGRDLN